jgi:SAM-dependent methyltransferase
MKRYALEFLDTRPRLREQLAGALFRSGLFLAPRAAAKARFVAYHHGLFHDTLRENCNKNGRELHSLMQLSHVLGAVRRLDRDPGGEILEIGAGRAGLPVLLLLAGFDKVHVNDLSNVTNRFPAACVETLYILASLIGACRRKLEDVVAPLDGAHVAIRPAMIETHPFTDAATLRIDRGALASVVSFTVLEHLQDPRSVFAHLHELLAPDGWMCHVVDMRDHEDFADPLRFLTIRPSEYRNRVGAWCNRLRHSDFKALFAETGFRLRSSRVTAFNELDARGSTDFWKMIRYGLHEVYKPELAAGDVWVTEDHVKRFDPSYRHYDFVDLSILQAEYVLERS